MECPFVKLYAVKNVIYNNLSNLFTVWLMNILEFVWIYKQQTGAIIVDEALVFIWDLFFQMVWYAKAVL